MSDPARTDPYALLLALPDPVLRAVLAAWDAYWYGYPRLVWAQEPYPAFLRDGETHGAATLETVVSGTFTATQEDRLREAGFVAVPNPRHGTTESERSPTVWRWRGVRDRDVWRQRLRDLAAQQQAGRAR